MNCLNCGNKTTEEMQFCITCGTPVQSGGSTGKEPALRDIRKKKKKGARRLLIAAVVIAGALVLCGAVVLLAGPALETASETALNEACGALVDDAHRGSDALTPADLGIRLPETDPGSVTALGNGQRVSSQTVFVCFKEGTSSKSMEEAAAAVGGTIAGEIHGIGFYIKFSEDKSGAEIEQSVGALKSLPQVESASPDYMAEVSGSLPDKFDVTKLWPGQKWGFERILLPEAWDMIKEQGVDLHPVTVAVIDTGFDLTHPELKDSFVLESGNCVSWDFGDGDDNVGPYIKKLLGDPFNEDKYRNHGTEISGVIASAVNGKGINGVAPTVKIFPIKVLDSNGDIPFRSIAAAITLATDAGVDVISMSVGFDYDAASYADSELKKAIALAAEKGIVIAYAAGNNSQDIAGIYPEADKNVLAVGAVNKRGERAVWSKENSSSYSSSPEVELIAAPGDSIYTTIVQRRFLLVFPEFYEFKSGTSLAAPFVAGLAALLKQIDPTLMPEDVRNILQDTADTISVTYPGGDATHEWKRINAKKAVQEVLKRLEGQTEDGYRIVWQKRIGGNGYDTYSVRALYQTKDGGTIFAGRTTSSNGPDYTNRGGKDAWIVKCSADGNTEWQRCLGGSGNEELWDITETNDGGYIAAGYTGSSDGDVTGNHGGVDGWVVKLGKDGGLQWQKCLGGSSDDDVLHAIIPAQDGGYIVVGKSNSDDGDAAGNLGNTDGWLVKIDGNGGVVWQKHIGGSNNEVLDDINMTSDGNFIAAGHIWSDKGNITKRHGSLDAMAVKLKSDGTVIWKNTYGGDQKDAFKSILPSADGGCLAAGYTDSSNGDATGNHGSYDGWVVKLDANGSVEWTKCFGGSGDDRLHLLRQTRDGAYTASGKTASSDGDCLENKNGISRWALHLGAAGEAEWQLFPPGGNLASDTASFALIPLRDGGYLANFDNPAKESELDVLLTKIRIYQ
ncbi:MAG: S8 family serine peptidase [Christensenellales bacterium]